jgi:hypothetical protein
VGAVREVSEVASLTSERESACGGRLLELYVNNTGIALFSSVIKFLSGEMNKDPKHNACDMPEEQYNEPQVDPALDLRKAKQAKVCSYISVSVISA